MDEIDFKNFDEALAYEGGQSAYYCTHRVSLADNPYEAGTRQAKAWAAGYSAAHDDSSE